MTPGRIAYVLHIFPKLSETFIATELAELVKRGVEVRILSLLPRRDALQHQVIEKAGLAALTTYGQAEFAEVIHRFRPDLLHAHFATEATAAARALSEASRVPYTFTAHGYDIFRKPPVDFRERAGAARGLVTVSEANAAYITRAFDVPRRRIEVIPCGIDTSLFRPAADAGVTSVGSTAPLVLCVARMVKVKNLGLLLEACALLRDSGVRFRCVILGDGPQRAELEEQRRVLRLDQVVAMPGAADQETVANYWRQATVGVLASHSEGMPVSLMEAAASAVPVVATRVGGVPELVEHEGTGFLTPPGAPKALAEALRALLTDAELRARMGAAARDAAARFSVGRQVDALLAFWSRACEGEGGRAAVTCDSGGAAWV